MHLFFKPNRQNLVSLPSKDTNNVAIDKASFEYLINDKHLKSLENKTLGVLDVVQQTAFETNKQEKFYFTQTTVIVVQLTRCCN